MKPVDTRRVYKWPQQENQDDWVVCEEPLEIRVEGQPIAVTMRTPGHDRELAAGFLYSEGVVDGADDFQALEIVPSQSQPSNTVDCVLSGGVEAHRTAIERATRELYATSSCGLCGKASIDRIFAQVGPFSKTLDFDEDLLLTLPQRMREAQVSFHSTGGIHGAALFTVEGQLEVIREDIGRHNAVDKILGYRLLQDKVPVDDRILVISSRAGFEIVQKAAVGRITAVVAMGAASSMAIDLANELGMKLYGFAGERRFNRYSPSSP